MIMDSIHFLLTAQNKYPLTGDDKTVSLGAKQPYLFA
jgi:hypothetical protein